MTSKTKHYNKEDVLNLLMSGSSFKDILNVNDDNMKIWTKKLNDFIKEKDFELAAELIFVLTSLDPYNKLLWYKSSKINIEIKNYDEATMAIAFALSMYPDDPILHVVAIQILVLSNNFDHVNEEIAIVERLLDDMQIEQVEMINNDYSMSIQDVREELSNAMYAC